jgi:hypothetical protein
MYIPLEYNGALDGTLWDGVFMAEKKQLETVLDDYGSIVLILGQLIFPGRVNCASCRWLASLCPCDSNMASSW